MLAPHPQRRTVAQRRERERAHGPRPAEPDRAAELAVRPDWAWTRVVRRHDDYELILRGVEQAHSRADAERAVTA